MELISLSWCLVTCVSFDQEYRKDFVCRKDVTLIMGTFPRCIRQDPIKKNNTTLNF